jgi:hypothetical protein
MALLMQVLVQLLWLPLVTGTMGMHLFSAVMMRFACASPEKHGLIGLKARPPRFAAQVPTAAVVPAVTEVPSAT